MIFRDLIGEPLLLNILDRKCIRYLLTPTIVVRSCDRTNTSLVTAGVFSESLSLHNCRVVELWNLQSSFPIFLHHLRLHINFLLRINCLHINFHLHKPSLHTNGPLTLLFSCLLTRNCPLLHLWLYAGTFKISAV